uniref:Cytochrome P450 26A1 n=1 Tax=Hucho hucho TaxID=62062 RepID=A0A4W5JU10_9TELE
HKILLEMGFGALFITCFCTLVLPLLLIVAVMKLWEIYVISGSDPTCQSPLPPGTMGLPFLGETLQMRRKFLKMKRQKYGYIYKTHLFGSPTVRIMGSEHVKQILMSEHKLVAAQWPASVRLILGAHALSNAHGALHKSKKKAIMKAFSREAMEQYIPVIREEVRCAVDNWLQSDSCVLMYPEMKRLMFRVAMRILLGFEPEQTKTDELELVEVFEEMIKNLFSLPIDVPFSGLYRGLRARNIIHSKIEQNIKKKLSNIDNNNNYKDVTDEIKESATELLFGGHETTASTATSLVMFLGLHAHVVRKMRHELQEKVDSGFNKSTLHARSIFPYLCVYNIFIYLQHLLGAQSDDKPLSIELLEQLKYIGCVIKETLRINPPVPGGFRVVLKTFELNGYQIPKGWKVIYSICDTHDVLDTLINKEEFQPERFLEKSPDDSSRFGYIPFGGGARTCVGKEFAKVLLKVFLVEVVTRCDWTLLNGPPTMKTGPTVYPVDNLPTKFTKCIQTY